MKTDKPTRNILCSAEEVYSELIVLSVATSWKVAFVCYYALQTKVNTEINQSIHCMLKNFYVSIIEATTVLE